MSERKRKTEEALKFLDVFAAGMRRSSPPAQAAAHLRAELERLERRPKRLPTWDEVNDMIVEGRDGEGYGFSFIEYDELCATLSGGADAGAQVAADEAPASGGDGSPAPSLRDASVEELRERLDHGAWWCGARDHLDELCRRARPITWSQVCEAVVAAMTVGFKQDGDLLARNFYDDGLLLFPDRFAEEQGEEA